MRSERALAARRRRIDVVSDSHDPAGRRLAVVGPDLKFFTPVAERLRGRGWTVDLDEWPSLEAGPTSTTEQVVADADALVAEWCGPNATWLAERADGRPLVVRVHRYDLHRPWLRTLPVDEVTALVTVGPEYRRRVVAATGWDPGRATWLPNLVPVDRLAPTTDATTRWTLGLLGASSARKRVHEAVALVDRLRARDERFVLRVAGGAPDPGADDAYFARHWPVDHPGVVLEPFTDDVAGWLAGIGWILSPSADESFHMAVAEGMASGCVPVVWPWPGADELYRSWVVADGTAALERILDLAADPDAFVDAGTRARHDVETWFPPDGTVDGWEALLMGRSPADAGLPAEPPGEPPLAHRLADERLLRAWAEERLTRAEERAATWRQRAEERKDRADRLAASRRPLLAIGSRPTADRPAPVESPSRTPDRPVPAPSLPVVVTTTLVDDADLGCLLDETDRRRPGPVALEVADVVVVDAPGWSSASATERDAVLDWARQTDRRPLVLVGPTEGLPGPLVEAADRRVADPPVTFPRDLGPNSEPAAGEALVDAATGRASLGEPSDHPFDSDRRAAAALRVAHRSHPALVAPAWLRSVGVDVADRPEGVAALLVSNRPSMVPAALERIAAQSVPFTEVVLVAHGWRLGDHGIEPPSGSVVLEIDGDQLLGACLDAAASASTAPILAKVDDDDHYGPGYVEDALQAIRWSGADCVGKGASFVTVGDATHLRRPADEFRWVEGTLPGATLVFRRHVWESVRFPHRPRFVDRLFQEAYRRLGGTVYAGSRWEFRQIRHGNGHTYDAGTDLLHGARHAWTGDHPGWEEVPLP